MFFRPLGDQVSHSHRFVTTQSLFKCK